MSSKLIDEAMKKKNNVSNFLINLPIVMKEFLESKGYSMKKPFDKNFEEEIQSYFEDPEQFKDNVKKLFNEYYSCFTEYTYF